MATASVRVRVSISSAVFTAIVLLLVTVAPAWASGPNGRIQGYVTMSGSATPISGASVHAEASDFPWVVDTTTDSFGFFQFAVAPHRYTLSISSPSFSLNQTGVAVGSAQTVWANMSLRPASSRTARFVGYVTDSVSSAPVTVGSVVARPWYGSASTYENRSALNASGYYSIDLVPDSYDIASDAVVGYVPYDYYPVYIGTGILWYNFTMDPNPVNAWINGTVLDDATSAPIAGATITARVDSSLVLPSATSDAAGRYSLPTQSGTVEIAADAAGYAPGSTSVYVWSAGSYFQDFRLPPLSRTIRGYLTDGVTKGAMPGVPVTVSPIFFSGYYDQTTTDGSGYFQVQVPDDYYSVQGHQTGYTTWTTWVVFFTNGEAWANGTLWPINSRVSGYLIDAANGSHVPGLGVQVADLRTSYGLFKPADAAGFFTFDVPPTPAMSIWVYGSGNYTGNVAYVETKPYQTTWVNITIGRLSSDIATHVTNALTGANLSGVTLIAAWYFGSDVQTTDVSGSAALGAPTAMTVYVTAIASGYQYWTGSLTTAAGTNRLDIALWPDLPTDVHVRGWVRDATSGVGIWPASVEATGYDGQTYTAYTNGTGYYDLSTVAAPQTVRAMEYGYAGSQATLNPSPGDSLWVNLTLAADNSPPSIRSFTATPSTGLDPAHPTALAADIGEASLDLATISILMMYSSSAGIGTFLRLGSLDPATVSMASPSAGNYSVTSSWDTRTPVGHLTDALTNVWWPVLSYSPFLAGMSGYYSDASLAAPVAGNALFDTRDGRLLFVVTGSDFVGPHDDPTSTFQPAASAVQIDLASAAIVGYSLVRGPTFGLGSLRLSYAPAVPSGTYAGLIETEDSSYQYSSAAVLMQTAADAVPPVANAGTDLTVNEDAAMTFDGFASTDNVGIASYTWTFMDGSAQILPGAAPTYVFAAPGIYIVTLTVRDADGNSATDLVTVTVRDVTRPSVSIPTPSESAHVSGSIGITVNASDNVGVVRVQLRVDGTAVANDTAAPFEFVLPSGSLSIGNHTLEVVAYDAAGNSASEVRHVTVVAAAGSPIAPALVVAGGIGFLVLLAVLVAFLILRGRRRRPVAAPLPTPSPPVAPLEAAAVQEAPVEPEPAAPVESPPAEPDPEFDEPLPPE